MPQEFTVLVFVLTIVVTVLASVSVGVGWWALHDSPTCTSTALRAYVSAVTITSTVEIAVCLLFILTTVLSYKFYCMNKIADALSYIIGCLLIIVSGLLSIIFFIWGILVLSTRDNCMGTPLFAVAIWFVVAGGLSWIRTYVTGAIMKE